MKILITGVCGFVGSMLARAFRQHSPSFAIYGIDNLSRPGSERNRRVVIDSGVQFIHGDLRNQADVDALPAVDWVIDAAANPSVLGGTSGAAGSRTVVDNNLGGTINLLEYCKQHRAGFILLSTSRVYSIPALSRLPVKAVEMSYVLDRGFESPGISERGISETFSTAPPLSIYGCTKLCSELAAIEYASAFGFPVWINRCGVMAGGGQFGRPDQGIFAYWLHSWRERKPLRYIGFDGTGRQVRDCLHPQDLFHLLSKQIETPPAGRPVIVNVSGGVRSAMSLAEISHWCTKRWGPHDVSCQLESRPYDLPWVVLDHSLATEVWDWCPQFGVEQVLCEIAEFAETQPHWLAVSQ